MIYLENFIRDRKKTHPISGIISYKNSGFPHFEFAEKLIEKIYNEYADLTGYQYADNFFYKSIYNSWKRLTQVQKIKRIQAEISDNDKFGNIFICDYLDDCRTIVSFKENGNGIIDHALILNLELYLKEKIDKRIEVFTEMVRDKNKLRYGRLDLT